MSDQPDNVNLAYIGRALDRLTTEVASLRDDMGVLTAIVIRLDGTLTALLIQSRYLASRMPT
jgi:hypothetical protein